MAHASRSSSPGNNCWLQSPKCDSSCPCQAARQEPDGHLGGNAVQAGAIEEDAEGDDDGIAHAQVGAQDDWYRAAAGTVFEIGEVCWAHCAQVLTLHGTGVRTGLISPA